MLPMTSTQHCATPARGVAFKTFIIYSIGANEKKCDFICILCLLQRSHVPIVLNSTRTNIDCTSNRDLGYDFYVCMGTSFTPYKAKVYGCHPVIIF